MGTTKRLEYVRSAAAMASGQVVATWTGAAVFPAGRIKDFQARVSFI